MAKVLVDKAERDKAEGDTLAGGVHGSDLGEGVEPLEAADSVFEVAEADEVDV